MEGLIITDLSCRPILSTHLTSRHIAATCLDVLAAEVIAARDAGTDVPPVLKLTAISPSSISHEAPTSDSEEDDSSDEGTEEDGGYEDFDAPKPVVSNGKTSAPAVGLVCCHISRGGLRYVVPVSSAVDPILVFAFLEALLAVLQDYYGTTTVVTEGLVKDNFDTVLLLLEEMLGGGGSRYPLVTEVATLKELVTPPSLVAKLLSAATAALGESSSTGRGATGVGQMPMTSNQALSSPLPWRKQGIRHKNNEIFFDIVEEIGAIVDRQGQLVTSEVWGSIECKCKLTGMPDLNMTLSNPKALEDCSFHPCVRLARWTTSKLLSFIPPEGRFTLMSYRLGAPSKAHPPSSLPLWLRPTITLGDAGGSFHLHLVSRLPSAKPLDNVVVTFRLGPHATSVSATTSGGRTLASSGPSSVSPDPESPPGGRWEFDARSGTLVWTLARLSSGDRPVELTGTWQSRCMLPVIACPSPQRLKRTHSVPMARPASSVQVAFAAPLVNISGMRVDSLKVTGDTAPPYKGVRPMLRSGSLEFRW